MRWLGLGSALLFFCPGVAFGKPSLSAQLGPETMLPAASRLVNWVQTSTIVDPAGKIAPEDMVRDPKKLIEFIEGRPDRLDVSKMDGALALTIAGVLIEGGAWLTAERLLFDGTKLWPNRADLRTTHGRVMIQLGRPNAALETLNKAVEAAPDNATVHFLRALAMLRIQPVTTKRRQESLAELVKVLELEPGFRDGSGWTAADVKSQIRQMKSGRPAKR
jgi:tetratricopeptide (TPR) repeat protein